MAEIPFPLPDLGEGLIEATVLEPGEKIGVGEPLIIFEVLEED